MKNQLKSKWSLKEPLPLFVEKTDKRYKRHLKQLRDNGFSDSETWGLTQTIAEFILPRLKRFKEIENGYPMGLTPAKWDEILDKIIFAFEWTLIEDAPSDKYAKLSHEEKMLAWRKYNEGMELFVEYFMELWW